MRFNFMAKIFNHTFFMMLAETQKLNGITSKTENGKHYIFWDLEKCTLEQAKQTLSIVQDWFGLSDIFIVSDIENSYRAFCFSEVDFKTFLKILLSTDYVDYNFFYWTVKRGSATSRTTDKRNRNKQKIVSVLESFPIPIPERFQYVEFETGVQKYGHNIILGKNHKFPNIQNRKTLGE
jgi:hypothetical protein